MVSIYRSHITDRRTLFHGKLKLVANWSNLVLNGQELHEYDIDHIIPRSLGGSEDDDNLQALCPACHRKKTDLERLRVDVESDQKEI